MVCPRFLNPVYFVAIDRGEMVSFRALLHPISTLKALLTVINCFLPKPQPTSVPEHHIGDATEVVAPKERDGGDWNPNPRSELDSPPKDQDNSEADDVEEIPHKKSKGEGENPYLDPSLSLNEERDKVGENANLDPPPNPKHRSDIGSLPMRFKNLEAWSKEERMQEKRKRDDLEELEDRKKYNSVKVSVTASGSKRKSEVLEKEVRQDSCSDGSKLSRTVFIGNLPGKMKRRALMNEFSRFGEMESIRIGYMPLVTSKISQNGMIQKGEINDALDSKHASIIFKDEKSAGSALSHNMAEIGGHHIHVYKVCPPCKKFKEKTQIWDGMRTLFIGNLPFDVKVEELYRLFCWSIPSESCVEAVLVIRHPHKRLRKTIAQILFKSREAVCCYLKQIDLNIRGHPLRFYNEKSHATASKSGRSLKKNRKRDRERENIDPNHSPEQQSLHKRLKNQEANGDEKSLQKKRKRDEMEELNERKRYNLMDAKAVPLVGTKRKSATLNMAVATDILDDESMLWKTVFIRNVSVKMKVKWLVKEFAKFGEVESVKMGPVPVVDSEISQKGAINQGKVNDSVKRMNAYIVFKDEQSVHSALSHNMAEVGGDQICIVKACPPRKKPK